LNICSRVSLSCLLILWFSCFAVSLPAQSTPVRLGMKLELMSIRTRSESPVPVRLRLEYNDPQVLEGDLELRVYDAIEFPRESDRLATIRREGIVLAGADYQTTLLLPPLSAPNSRNWAVVATFYPEGGDPISLTSVPAVVNPPQPFDLLITSGFERCFLMCSVADVRAGVMPAGDQKFLEERLLLESVAPLRELAVHHTVQWDIGDFSDNPLHHCAADVILLNSGMLQRLSESQRQGLLVWVRAGGSLCIHHGGTLRQADLDLLRELLGNELKSETDLLLSDEGQLLLTDSFGSGLIEAYLGLGRVALISDQQTAESLLSEELRARQLLGFLWKIRKDHWLFRGLEEEEDTVLETVRRLIPDAEKDEFGIYVPDLSRVTFPVRRMFRWEFRDGRNYLTPESLNPTSGALRGSIVDPYPRDIGLLNLVEKSLLPRDFRMVPTSIFALIMLGYVFAVGPLDYFLLGWLRCRRYTWFLFPVVTAFFTALTVGVAVSYMGSEDTGGELIITDLDERNGPVRQTHIETMFFGSAATAGREYRNSLLVQAGNATGIVDSFGMATSTPALVRRDDPPEYRGNTPQSFSISQFVPQWSPVTLRQTTFDCQDTEIPSIPWNDATLVTTFAGQSRLQGMIKVLDDSQAGRFEAQVHHLGGRTMIYSGTRTAEDSSTGADPLRQLVAAVPAVFPDGLGAAGLVSQFSPQGGAGFEDLAISDVADAAEYVLVISRIRGQKVEVFRRRYRIPDEAVESGGQ